MGKRTQAQGKRTKRSPRKQKVKKDGPKKPKSGFMFYSQERRKSLKDEQPELKITEASKVIAREWRAMDEEKKAPYEDLAKKDRERYQRAKEEMKEEEHKESAED